MVVQHNLSAMNTNRQMGTVTNALSKSTEKLSSGYKINRAYTNIISIIPESVLFVKKKPMPGAPCLL